MGTEMIDRGRADGLMMASNTSYSLPIFRYHVAWVGAEFSDPDEMKWEKNQRFEVEEYRKASRLNRGYTF